MIKNKTDFEKSAFENKMDNGRKLKSETTVGATEHSFSAAVFVHTHFNSLRFHHHNQELPT